MTSRNDLVRFGIRLDGRLEVERLLRAVLVAGMRHPILTGRFVRSGSEFMFRTHECELVLDTFDHPFPSSYHSPDANIPSMLDGPLFRMGLARVGHDAHELLLVADHAIMDFRSVSLILNEVFRLYDGNVPDDLDVKSFGWWTSWERDHLSNHRLERHLRFWRSKLSVCGPLPESGFSCGVNRTHSGSYLERQYRVSEADADRLRTYCRTRGLPPFTLLSALWKCAQHGVRRLTGEVGGKDVVASLGAFPNRLTPSVWRSVGAFSTSAIIASQIDDGLSLDAHHAMEDHEYLTAAVHQALPHGFVLRDMSPELYGVRYDESREIPAYLNFDMPAAAAEQLAAPASLRLHVGIGLPADPPRGGLRVIVAEQGRTWILNARYRTDLYSAERLDAFQHVWDTLATWWLANAKAPLAAALREAELQF